VAKKSQPQAIPEIAPLALADDEKPIEGAPAIARALGLVDKRNKPRTQLVKFRLMNNLIPHYRVGVRYVTTLKLLRTMAENVVRAS
jgi:hypothetical protein